MRYLPGCRLCVDGAVYWLELRYGVGSSVVGGWGNLMEAGTGHVRTHTNTQTKTRARARWITQLGKSVLRTSLCLHFQSISAPASSQRLGYSNRLTVRIMKITVLRDVMRRGLASRYKSFGATLGTHFHCSLRFTNPCSTNKCTVPLLRLSLLFSSYMFQLNCHHQGADTILLKLTALKQPTVLQISDVLI
jgi:hypothetical protein